jgi:hypothetical protein
MSAVNGFFKDHGLEVVALGDLAAKVIKDLPPHMSRLKTRQYMYTCQPSS